MDKSTHVIPKSSRPPLSDDSQDKKPSRSDSDHLYVRVGPAGLNDTPKSPRNTPNFKSLYLQRNTNKPHPNSRFTAFQQFLNYQYKSKIPIKPEIPNSQANGIKISSLNTHTESLYDILEIEANCLDSDIRKAFRRLASKHHPDKGGSTEEFQRIKEAYEVLSKPE